MSFIRIELCGCLKTFNGPNNVALLEQRLSQLVMRISELGLRCNDLAHQLDASWKILSREADVAKIILGLQIVGIQRQLGLKFLPGLIELSQFQVNNT